LALRGGRDQQQVGEITSVIFRWSEISVAIAGCRNAEENFVGGFVTKACARAIVQ
jgi:hypothetical protein